MSAWNQTPWWVRALSGIGAYALGVEVLKRTANLGRRRISPTVSGLPAPETREFVRALSRGLGLPHGNGGSIELLHNGDEFFPALFEAVAGAEHHVHLMTYIWEDGEVSDTLIDLLLEKLRAGVEVRILVDGIGARRIPQGRFRRLRQEGASIKIYAHPLSENVIHINRRNHRRAMVIDGRTGFTGGVSISDKWLGDGEDPDRFRDTMICARGRPAHAVQWLFLQLWANTAYDELVGPEYFPEDLSGIVKDDEPPYFLSLAQTPAIRVQPVKRLYWLSFKAARKSIYLSSGYFAPDPALRELLRSKAREGVDVRLLLPGPYTDNPVVKRSAQLQYESYLEAGIRIFEYQPGMLHAKLILVDDVWSMIGSADVGVRSFKINHEGVFGIADPAVGRALLKRFRDDFERSVEIEMAEWRRRGVLRRGKERISALLHAQY